MFSHNPSYTPVMAWTGHTEEQTPQSAHFAASIQRFPAFSEIASTGHSLSQEPQFVQVASLTT
jgi:hypothetical protein